MSALRSLCQALGALSLLGIVGAFAWCAFLMACDEANPRRERRRSVVRLEDAADGIKLYRQAVAERDADESAERAKLARFSSDFRRSFPRPMGCRAYPSAIALSFYAWSDEHAAVVLLGRTVEAS